jgi:hypothetical protein
MYQGHGIGIKSFHGRMDQLIRRVGVGSKIPAKYISMNNWLVVYQPSEKYVSPLGLLFPIYGKKQTCSKPPTR